MRRTYRVNADRIDVLIDLLVATPEDFNSDRDILRGRIEKHPMVGRLDGADYDTLMSNRRQERISYVIYSYNTPIAWRVSAPNNAQHWVMPQHPPATNTTSKHVNKVRTALSQISGGI